MFPIFRIKTHSQYTQLTFSWTFQCYPCVLILLFSCFSEVTPFMIGFFFYLTLLKHLLQTYEFNWKLFHRHFFMFWSFLSSDSWVISGAWNIYYFSLFLMFFVVLVRIVTSITMLGAITLALYLIDGRFVVMSWGHAELLKLHNSFFDYPHIKAFKIN